MIVIIVVQTAVILMSFSNNEVSEPFPVYDYINVGSTINGYVVTSVGVGSSVVDKLRDEQGKKIESVSSGIELMEAQGYRLVNTYANNMGHFATMRKKVQ